MGIITKPDYGDGHTELKHTHSKIALTFIRIVKVIYTDSTKS